MFAATAALLVAALLAYLFLLRQKDLPEPAPVNPYAYLEARKAAIYDNLRDLQFEYRVGKLSDSDYQAAKNGLQTELATVLAEIDRMKQTPAAVAATAPAKPASSKPKPPTEPGRVCPSCGAKFDKPLKFCGECGKSMGVSA